MVFGVSFSANFPPKASAHYTRGLKDVKLSWMRLENKLQKKRPKGDMEKSDKNVLNSASEFKEVRPQVTK